MVKKKRKFDGKIYSLSGITSRKKDVKDIAEGGREGGLNVRVVKRAGSYLFYTRKKRRRKKR